MKKPSTTTTAKAKKQSHFLIRILKSPIIVLHKVTNAYMNIMSSCANTFGESNVVNCSIAPQVSNQLPRNFSVSSSKESQREEELRDLIRAVSTKLSEAKVEIKDVDGFRHKPITGLGNGGVDQRRSYSVGIGKIGRIDEDAPCDFKESAAEINVNLYPRCRSYAVPCNRIAVRS